MNSAALEHVSEALHQLRLYAKANNVSVSDGHPLAAVREQLDEALLDLADEHDAAEAVAPQRDTIPAPRPPRRENIVLEVMGDPFCEAARALGPLNDEPECDADDARGNR